MKHGANNPDIIKTAIKQDETLQCMIEHPNLTDDVLNTVLFGSLDILSNKTDGFSPKALQKAYLYSKNTKNKPKWCEMIVNYAKSANLDIKFD